MPQHQLLLLTRPEERELYQEALEAAHLPNLKIVSAASSEVEIVFGTPPAIRAALPNLPGLKWCQSTWAGVEPLLDPNLRRDYVLTNARGVFGGYMSEYVFGYLLLFQRKILETRAAQQQGNWEQQILPGLEGKTFGLLGVGSIGAHLAATARHFGMRVLGYTRSSEDCPDVERYYHGAELNAFARELDVLVVVLPSTAWTRHLVNADFLSALPERAILFNIGRGQSLDEKALVEALRAGKIATAVLDVFEEEPLPAGHPFWSMPNVFVTPHDAAHSFPADLVRVFEENYRRYDAGLELKYRVDFERGY